MTSRNTAWVESSKEFYATGILRLRWKNCADNEGDCVEYSANSVKDIPKIYVNFIVTVGTVSEKKIVGCVTFARPLAECLSFHGWSDYHVRDYLTSQPRRIKFHCYGNLKLFIHSVVYLKTDSQPRPQRVHHRVQYSASSFNLQYPFLSLGSSSSCLRLLLRLPVASNVPSIFPSIACFRMQFLW